MKLYSLANGRLWGGLLAGAVSALLYALHGFGGVLGRDNAIYTYSGQQMLAGIAPYLSVFDHKGPMASILCGLALSVSRKLGIDDVLAVRIAFWLISAFAVVMLFLLAEKLIKSLRSAAFASAVFIGFWGFGIQASMGPRAKTPMVLFQIMALYFTASRRWFLGGLAGGLAMLVWQPMIVYPAVTFLVSILQADSARQAFRNAVRSATGAAVPVIAVALYYWIRGGLGQFWVGWVTFNLEFLERQDDSAMSNVHHIMHAISAGYAQSFVWVYAGLLSLLAITIKVLMNNRGRQLYAWVQRDSRAVLLLTFPLPFAWSVLDFQGYADFYPFLVYAAIGAALLLERLAAAVEQRKLLTPRQMAIVAAIVVAVLLVRSGREYWSTGGNIYGGEQSIDLAAQRHWAEQATAYFSRDDVVLTIGLPEDRIVLAQVVVQ